MAELEINMKAFRELAVELRGKAPDEIANKVGLVHRKTAMDVKRTMMAKAPVDTGAMRASTTLKTTGDPHSVLESHISPTVEYTIYVNEGTYKMAARPFIDDAIEAHADAYFAALEAVVSL